MNGLRILLGLLLAGISLCLLGFTVFCFSSQPDRFAAFTVLPIWFWGSCGLLISGIAFYGLRLRLTLLVALAWMFTILFGSDESKALKNALRETPQPGPAAKFEGRRVFRVMTANCAAMAFGDPTADIVRWNPDLLLLQDIPPRDVERICKELYAGKGSFRTFGTNSIITRWKIQRSVFTPPGQRCQQVTITTPNGFSFDVVNVHLLSAATDLRFWNRKTWSAHRRNRALRAQELSTALRILEATTLFPITPTIFGGDFNAPAGDVIHHMLSDQFTNSFAIAGTGWGNTYQRRLPILRIDHIYATNHFTPVRSRAVMTKHSDHRMVVTDFTAKR